jgi:hypothetical protein
MSAVATLTIVTTVFLHRLDRQFGFVYDGERLRTWPKVLLAFIIAVQAVALVFLWV